MHTNGHVAVLLKFTLAVLLLCSAPLRAETRLDRLMQAIDEGQYETDLNVLAGTERFTPANGWWSQVMTDRFRAGNLKKARRYLTDRLKGMGFENPEHLPFKLKLKEDQTVFGQLFKGGRTGGVNIVAEIKGSERPDEIVTYVAHYDTTGKYMPGADDNGSGVAALLSTAEAFMKTGIRPKRTVRFLLADAEERSPLYQGSEDFFEKSLAKGEKNILVMNLDMIGYSPTGQNTGGYSAELFPKAKRLLEKASEKAGLNLEMTAFEPFYSDNLPPTFKGIPSLAITEDARDARGRLIETYPHYHEGSDLPGEVNIPYAKTMTKWSAAALFLAANSDRTFDTTASLRIAEAHRRARGYREEGNAEEAFKLAAGARHWCMRQLERLGGEDEPL